MSKDDSGSDSSYIKLPTSLLIAVIGAVGLGGAGTYGLIGTVHPDQLSTHTKRIEEIRETARVSAKVAEQNTDGILYNRRLIAEGTYARYTSSSAGKDWRAQEARNRQIERRIEMLEREIERLGKD